MAWSKSARNCVGAGSSLEPGSSARAAAPSKVASHGSVTRADSAVPRRAPLFVTPRLSTADE
eukprot:7337474-Lingulodinium_polyedra.AAC.1